VGIRLNNPVGLRYGIRHEIAISRRREARGLDLRRVESFEFTDESVLIEGDDEMLKESIHAQESRNGEIFLEGGFDGDWAAWNI